MKKGDTFASFDIKEDFDIDTFSIFESLEGFAVIHDFENRFDKVEKWN